MCWKWFSGVIAVMGMMGLASCSLTVSTQPIAERSAPTSAPIQMPASPTAAQLAATAPVPASALPAGTGKASSAAPAPGTPPPAGVTVTATAPSNPPGPVATGSLSAEPVLAPGQMADAPSSPAWPAATAAAPTSMPPSAVPATATQPAPASPAPPTVPAPAPTATRPPKLQPTAAPAAPSLGLAPQVHEGSITINTYDYQSALVATEPGDPVYPYPRLNHDRVGPPSPRKYQTVVLENQYMELTILPELGGRIYRWIDKATGRNLFYQNPVIKPTSWGNRGWWLATGGMEWALPLDEHGLSEASPWDFTIQQGANAASVALSNTEKHSGLQSEITIKLDADHSYFTLVPRIVNPSSAPVSYKFWVNGMFSLGAHQVGPGIEFVLPTSQVTVHSTGDHTLPGEYETMSWPYYSGRNLADYGTWTGYLGVFAAPQAQADFMGAYNHNTNLGVVRIFPHLLARGAKIFGPGDMDPKVWTDDGSSYFELWGGLAPTFRDEVVLEAGRSVVWEERWYAVGDMGGFAFANQAAALNLGVTPTSVQVAAASTRWMSGRLVLWRNGKQVTSWTTSISPIRPFRGSFAPPDRDAVGPWGLSLHDEMGNQVAATGRTGLSAANEPADSPVLPVSMQTPIEAAAPLTLTVPGTEQVLVLDRDGKPRDWPWVQSEFGYELRRAPSYSADGRVFRLVKLQEAESGPVYLVEVRNEAGGPLSSVAVAQSWPGAPKDISGYADQAWHGLRQADYGYPDANGNWGVTFGPEGMQPPGQGQAAFFVLSADIPSDVLARVAPLKDSRYRVLRPTFQLVREIGGPPEYPTSTPVADASSSNKRYRPAVWDKRLDALGITVTPAQAAAGKPVYRLVAARYQDETQSNSLHHIYVEVIDQGGRRIVGQRVVLAWEDGEAVMVTEDKPSPEYAANVPMYNYLGMYRVYVDGGASDVVNGLGLPGKEHVCYLLTFQKVK